MRSAHFSGGLASGGADPGEAGCIGGPPAVLNAVADALGRAGDHVQLPAIPEHVLGDASPPMTRSTA